MSTDHHRAAGDIATTTAVDAIAMEVAGHAGGDTRPQHGSAAPGLDPVAAAPLGMPPGIDASMGAQPRAHDSGQHRRRARSSSPTRQHGDFSRSPRGAGATPGRNVPVPDSPSWHDAKPGPSATFEDLRFWAIHQVGSIQETARLAGMHIHDLRKEVETLKARVSGKAEAEPVAAELDRLRGELGQEFQKVRKELDQTEVIGRIADLVKDLGNQTQTAFLQVSAVEASLQTHVSQGFSEAESALQWLESQTSTRLGQLETEVGKFSSVRSAAHVAAVQQADAPPPPAPTGNRRAETRQVAAAPVLNMRGDFAGQAGCAAGPFACGCGGGTAEVPGRSAALDAAGPTGNP